MLEQIKQNIAEELKKQYKTIVEDEYQALGDLRDKDVKEREKINIEAER